MEIVCHATEFNKAQNGLYMWIVRFANAPLLRMLWADVVLTALAVCA